MTAAPHKRAQLVTLDDLRLLGCCLAGTTLLAIMTGPGGTIAQPTSGITGALHPSHWVPYLVFGVVLCVVMSIVRKTRRGELRWLSTVLADAVGWIHATWDAALRSTAWRWIIGGGLLALALVVAFFLADLTGPYYVDKLGTAGLQHQFRYSYAYGYLLFGVIIWWLAWRRVLERHGLREPSQPRTGALHTLVVVAACVVAGLVLAVTADPWLNPRFHGSDVALTGGGSSIFGQWPTYLWLGLSLVVAWRILHLQRHGAAVTHDAPGRRFLTPQLSLALYAAMLFIAVEWPKFLFPYWQSLLALQIGIYALLALGLNVVVGFAGLLDLGYVAFYAVGAYVGAYFSGALPIKPPFVLPLFWSVPLGIGAAMLAGVLLGLPTLRLRGDYLAIVTLGFGEIVGVTLNNWTSATYGSIGTHPIPPFAVHIFGFKYLWSNANPLPYYYLILGFIVVAIFVFNSLNNSRVGRRWATIREDEIAAASIGVNPLKYKVMAFAIGASTAGFAGVFYASTANQVFPVETNFGLQISILILALVIFGGMGSIGGVIAGAAIYYWLYLYLQVHPFPGYNPSDFYMWLGAIFVLLMIFRPQGLFPARRRAREIRMAEAGIGFADPMSAERGESDEFERRVSDEGAVAGVAD